MIEPEVLPYEERARRGQGGFLWEASEYFMQRGPIFETLRDLTRRFEEASIPYAVIEAIALPRHGLERMTVDIDILLTPEGLAVFRARYVGRGYVAAFPGARKTFRAAETGVRIGVITTGEYPGDGKPKPVRFPHPEEASVDIDGVRVLRLERLVELKLASGMTAPHRLRDLSDVLDLIRLLRLPSGLAEQLDSSVRPLYQELWQKAQTPDALQEE
jgi:hypothetical protein